MFCASMSSHGLMKLESVSSICALERSTPRMASPYSSTRNSISSSADSVVMPLNLYCKSAPSATKTTPMATVNAVRAIDALPELFFFHKLTLSASAYPPPEKSRPRGLEANGAFP